MSDVRLRRAPIVLRAEEGAPEGILVGYASVYDVQYRIGYGLSEEIAPGAFDASIRDGGGVIPIFYQHDWTNPIGVARASSDAHGLKVEAQLFVADNERARSVYLATAAGALREWSVGFYPSGIELRAEDGEEVERVTAADLAEASVVVRGANPETEMVSVRSAEARAEAEAVFYRAAMPDPDDDPAAIAQAIDAANDALADALAEGDVESAQALSVAVDMAVDRLLDLLGVADPGESEDDEPGDNGVTSGAPLVPGYLAEKIDRPHVREIVRRILARAAAEEVPVKE